MRRHRLGFFGLGLGRAVVGLAWAGEISIMACEAQIVDIDD